MQSQAPKYVTIKALLQARWESSMLPGDRLPSEKELCTAFSVSRATVQQALQIFEREGVIRRDQGRGTFYVGRAEGRTEQEPSQLLESLIREREGTETRVLRKALERPPARIAERLGLSREEQVVVLERLGLLDGAPLVFIYSYLPAAIGLRLLEDETQLKRMSLAAQLNDRHGQGIASVHQTISARLSDPCFAPALGIEVGVPVLLGERTYCDGEGRPVFCAVSYYRSDRHAFTMQVKDWR
jgi:GntR family transcriptional regulator